MSFNQMAEASGLSEKTCRNQIEKLIEYKFITVIERNIYGAGKIKKPNKYKLLIGSGKNKRSVVVRIDNSKEIKDLFLDALQLLEADLLKKKLNKKDYSHYRSNKYFNSNI